LQKNLPNYCGSDNSVRQILDCQFDLEEAGSDNGVGCPAGDKGRELPQHVIDVVI